MLGTDGSINEQTIVPIRDQEAPDVDHVGDPPKSIPLIRLVPGRYVAR